MAETNKKIKIDLGEELFYQQISEQNIVRSYYENGYVQDYDYKKNIYFDPRKMTEEEHEYVQKKNG